MVAESIKPYQIHTEKQQLIIACKTDNPDQTMREIAEQCDTSHSYVSEILHKYKLIKKTIDDFREYQADILLGVKERIISSISDEDLQKASLQQKLTSLGIAHDKEQELRGRLPEGRPMVIINKMIVNQGKVEGKSIDVVLDVDISGQIARSTITNIDNTNDCSEL